MFKELNDLGTRSTICLFLNKVRCSLAINKILKTEI